MKYKLSIILITALCASLISCSGSGSRLERPNERETAFMESTEDMGQEYIDSFIFIGESTTYHLKSRGVLSGGRETRQVWAPESGTLNLDSTITGVKIVYPETGERITIGEAAARKQPRRVLLTFGLNGAVQKVAAGEQYFRECYLSLIDAIRENSPNTQIIIQSCFPVSAHMDMTNYSVSAAQLCQKIATINSWSAALANDLGIGYLNTAEVLTDEGGFLIDGYDAGDGHHLNAQTYRIILEYIRTHAHKEK
jgi:hypothetical protein